MFGCIGRIVVLAVLIILGAVAYATRSLWEPKLRERMGAKPAATAAAPTWEPVTSDGAARLRTQLEAFKRPSGPVFMNVGAGDLVAYAAGASLAKLAATPPSSSARGGTQPAAQTAEALAGENSISVRGHVRMSDLRGMPSIGVLDGTQRIEVRGRAEVTAPGKALLRVERIVLGELPLPGAVIGKVVQRIAPQKDKSLPAEAVELSIPAEVADIRITKGRVTLYKAVK